MSDLPRVNAYEIRRYHAHYVLWQGLMLNGQVFFAVWRGAGTFAEMEALKDQLLRAAA